MKLYYSENLALINVIPIKLAGESHQSCSNEMTKDRYDEFCSLNQKLFNNPENCSVYSL